MKHVSVLGLGRVGLPVALILEKCGYHVTGVDVNLSHLNAINEKTLRLDEPDIEVLFKESHIQVTNRPTASDVFIICVPTPLTPDNRPDLSYFQNAIEMIRPYLRTGTLVIIESTCPIGTTEKTASEFPGVHFAYCPERIMPGKLLNELIECDRIIGGVDQKATDKAIEFYSRFSRGKLHKTEAKMAEAVKLAENTYRNVNVALANELSMIAARIGIADWELISLANCHPRVNILNPGPGAGGHCIPVDPEFLIHAFPSETSLLQAARNVNEQKRIWVEENIEEVIRKYSCQTVTLLGLTYKANTSDFRNSRAFTIYNNLREKYNVLAVDPFFPESVSLQAGIDQAEVVVGLVAHDAFQYVDRDTLKGKIVLDYAEVFRR